MATQQDFTAARVAATGAADIEFGLAQAAYPADMDTYRKHLAEFRKAKDTEKEASAREIAAVLHPITAGADNALRTATTSLTAEIAKQKKDGTRANEVAFGVNLLLGALLLFAL